MITKDEGQIINRALMADDRRRVGEPPSPDEMLAYKRGELSPEEEERMRERLVCYPELLRALIAEFPSEEAQPGDPDYLSDIEFARHKARLPKAASARRFDFRTAFSAVAATLVLLLGGFLWRAEWLLRQPRAWDAQVLQSDNSRGIGESQALTIGGADSVLLFVPFNDEREFDTYRLDLQDASSDPPRPLWRKDDLRHTGDVAISVAVPTTLLKAGRYRIVLHGVNGTRDDIIGTYTFHVPAR